MARIARFVQVTTLAAVAATSAVACRASDDDDIGFGVTSRVVSDTNAPEIQALAPDAEGTWPVVVALHGLNGSGSDMVELGTRLASGGAVVFAPTYSTDLTTAAGLARAGDDLVCAYQLALSTAPELGGDLTQPVTVVGWSLGADLALLGTLDGSGNTSARCPGETPEPDVVVGLSGCYYEFDGKPVTWFDDAAAWANTQVDIHLVDGDDDTVCPAWQTEQLAASLRGSGYDVELVELEEANHYAPVFHDVVDGQWQVITDDPAGEHAVTIILDAIDAARADDSAD